jgi:hypothetical protein
MMADTTTEEPTADKLDSSVFLKFVAQQAITQRDTTNAATQVAAQNQIISGATEEQIAGVRAAASADAMASTAVQGRMAETDAANALAKSFLGLNPQEASFRLENLASTQREAYDKANEIAIQIRDKKSATLLSDPIGYINAQFTLPADVAQYNYYAGLHNNAEAEYKSIVDSGTNTGQMNKALQATTSVAEGEAAIAKIRAIAAEKEAVLKIQGAQLQVSGVKELQQLSVSALNQRNLAVSVYEGEQRMKFQREQFAALQEQRRLAREAAALNRKSKEDAIADEDQMVAAYNLAAARDGYAELPRSVILARAKRAGADGELVRLAITRGENLLLAPGNGENVPVGKNAVESALYYSHTGGTPVGTTASTVNFLKNRMADLAADSRVAIAKNPEEKAAIINKLLQEDAAKQQLAIRPNEPNIYAALPPLALAQAVPALLNKQFAFLQQTVYPMSEAAPGQPIKDDAIVAAALVEIKKNPSRLNEIVTTLGTYYSAAATANNKLKGYAQVGLPLQSGYMAQIGKEVMDLTDTLALRRYMMVKGLAYNNPLLFGPVEAR